MASYIGGNKHFEALYLSGAISLELVPQGSLVARLRAAASGVPAFYTPTGARTAVELGSIPIRYKPGGVAAGVAIEGRKKEAREFGGRRYVLEEAIRGDVAFVRAWKVDEVGNCVFRCVFVSLARAWDLVLVGAHMRARGLAGPSLAFVRLGSESDEIATREIHYFDASHGGCGSLSGVAFERYWCSLGMLPLAHETADR